MSDNSKQCNHIVEAGTFGVFEIPGIVDVLKQLPEERVFVGNAMDKFRER